ncbi:MAG: DUF937 domain-containing protein [Geitlerinemataceae cyanobacterium]
MGLFDKIAGAINDPNLQASVGQLGEILGGVQQASNTQGMDASSTQAVISALGGHVRSALQEKRASEGIGGVQNVINQFGGTGFNPQAVLALFSPQQQQQVSQAISGATGIDASMIQALLPTLIPTVLNFLKMGSTQGAPTTGQNPILKGFLDTDGDGDVDLGDAISMAGRFLNR